LEENGVFSIGGVDFFVENKMGLGKMFCRELEKILAVDIFGKVSEKVWCDKDMPLEKVADDFLFVHRVRLSPSSRDLLMLAIVEGGMASLISLVLPYLPLEITLALMMPSMSSSAMISEMRRWVRGLSRTGGQSSL